MTPTRFAALAEAYGGRIETWPEAEQDAALAYLVENPASEALLTAQTALDSVLAAWTVPGPGAALAGRIVSSVGRGNALARRLKLWVSGLGAAAALASGIAVGVTLVGVTPPASSQYSGRFYQLTVLGAPLDLETDSGVEGGF